MKRKKLTILILFLLLLLAGTLYSYPRSMDSLLNADDTLFIVYHEDIFSSQGPVMKSATYEIATSSDTYAQMKDLFSKYKFFRYPRTLIKSNGIRYGERSKNYSFSITAPHTDDWNHITFGGDGRVLIDDRLYRMDLWGNDTQTKLMEELKSIIDGLEPTSRG
ncbi:MAG: hypothetical protein Q4F05_03290 [bacterium]|nr:hypothetical protein [bacterium]